MRPNSCTIHISYWLNINTYNTVFNLLSPTEVPYATKNVCPDVLTSECILHLLWSQLSFNIHLQHHHHLLIFPPRMIILWQAFFITMHSLHSVHEINTYRAGQIYLHVSTWELVVRFLLHFILKNFCDKLYNFFNFQLICICSTTTLYEDYICLWTSHEIFIKEKNVSNKHVRDRLNTHFTAFPV